MPLTIASGDTRTLTAGSDLVTGGINIGGQLNLAGQANADSSLSAGGTATTTGTAVGTTQRLAIATATGSGSGAARAVETFLPGVEYTTDGLSVDTQHNLGGQLNAEDPSLISASGTGDSVGTASANPETRTTATGVGQGLGATSTTATATPTAPAPGEGWGRRWRRQFGALSLPRLPPEPAQRRQIQRHEPQPRAADKVLARR